MRTQIHTIVAPRGGLNLGLPADLITDVQMADAENVFFQDGFIKTRPGYVSFGTNLPLSGSLVQIDQFKDFDETTWLFALTDKNIYRGTSIGADWDIWPGPNDGDTAYGEETYGEGLYGGAGAGLFGSGLYGAGLYGQSQQFSGSDSDFWSFDFVQDLTQSQPWWVATNNVDPVVVFKGGSNTAWEELLSTIDGARFRARFLIEFKSHLLFLDTDEGGSRLPQRIRWSNTADPSNIDTGNASFRDLSGTDWIVGAIKFRGDLLCVLKEDSIWIAWATGGSDIFQFDRKIDGQGGSAPRTIKVINGNVVFLGREDVYLFDGVGLRPLGVNPDDPQSTKVRRELVEQINFSEIFRAFSLVREQEKEYWTFIPTNGTYPDTAFVFNYALRSWSKHVFANNSITGHGTFQSTSAVAYDDLVGAYDAQTWRFGDRSLGAGSPGLLLGDNEGNVFEYSILIADENGFVMNKQFETKDFNFTQLGTAMRINRADVSYTGSMDVYYSTDKGLNFNFIATLPETQSLSRKKLSFRTTCDWIRFRFRINKIGGNYQFNRMNVFWQNAGRIGV